MSAGAYLLEENRQLKEENASLKAQLANMKADKEAFEYAVEQVTQSNRAISALVEEQKATIIELIERIGK